MKGNYNSEANDDVLLPDRLLTKGGGETSVTFIPYSSHIPVVKGRSSLKQHMISLITEGEKLIHTGDNALHVTPENILLLSAGNYLYTERFSKGAQVKSIMVFFDHDYLRQAVASAKGKSTHADSDTPAKQPFALFAKDDYINSYIQSVRSLIDNGLLEEPLQVIKLQELLTYLCARYPEPLETFQSKCHLAPGAERVVQVMEDSRSAGLSVSELAFLCHMSEATFKRKFKELYNQSPAKWIQMRRLKNAANMLERKHAKPGDVYLEAGYENHSSFSKAFKQQFGVLPQALSCNERLAVFIDRFASVFTIARK